VTDPLFAVLPGPTGPVRAALDAKVDELAGLDPVLTLVCRALADRIDWAIGGRQYRGFVMITAEFRAAYRDLIGEHGADTGPDEFDRLVASLDSAEAGHRADPGPGH
jgi:hypothetical protein